MQVVDPKRAPVSERDFYRFPDHDTRQVQQEGCLREGGRSLDRAVAIMMSLVYRAPEMRTVMCHRGGAEIDQHASTLWARHVGEARICTSDKYPSVTVR